MQGCCVRLSAGFALSVGWCVGFSVGLSSGFCSGCAQEAASYASSLQKSNKKIPKKKIDAGMLSKTERRQTKRMSPCDPV